MEASPENIVLSGLVHRVYRPNSSGPLPTVVFVHGRAGNASSMWTFSATLSKERPLVVAPQGVVADEKGGWSWWEVESSKNAKPESLSVAQGIQKLTPAFDALEHFVNNLQLCYGTDPQRVYAFGFSQGAALVAGLSLRNPTLFRGVAMLAGFLPRVTVEAPDFISRAVRERAVLLPRYFITHGTSDKVLPLEKANFAKTSLESLGAQVTFHTEDIGHKVGSSGMKALKAWFADVHK